MAFTAAQDTKNRNGLAAVTAARSLWRRTSHWTHVGEGGRVVIPAEIRTALGIRPGDRVLVEMEDGAVRISTRERSMRRSQERLRPYLEGTPSLVDELLAERRREAERE